MGDLNTAHEEFLATSLEDSEYFGQPITIRDRTGTYSYDVNGSVNKVMPQMEGGAQPKPVGKRTGISVRHTALLEAAEFPTAGWEGRMPTFGWIVDTVSPWTNQLETFTIERGSIAEDTTLGIDTYWLTEYQE